MRKMTMATAGCVLALAVGVAVAQQQQPPQEQTPQARQLGGTGPYINFDRPVPPEQTQLGPIRGSVTTYGPPPAEGQPNLGGESQGSGAPGGAGRVDTPAQEQHEPGTGNYEYGGENPQQGYGAEYGEQALGQQGYPPQQPTQQQGWGQPQNTGWGRQNANAGAQPPYHRGMNRRFIEGREVALIGTIVNTNASVPGINNQVVEVITHSGRHVFIDVGEQGRLQNELNLANNQTLYFLGTVEFINNRPLLMAQQVAPFGQLTSIQRSNPNPQGQNQQRQQSQQFQSPNQDQNPGENR